jgi:hypothetical protein
VEGRNWGPRQVPMRYALCGFIAGAIPGITAALVQGTEGSALVWLITGLIALLTSLAGIGIGWSRPVARDLALVAPAVKSPGIMKQLGVGLVVGISFAYLGLMLWFNLGIALSEPGRNPVTARPGSRSDAVLYTPDIAIAGSALTSFLSGLFGALLGGAIRTERYTSPNSWVAAWAAVLGLLIGSNTATLTGTLLPFDIAMMITLTSSIPAGIAAALIVWILVKWRLTAPNP